jgi:hypothetical protein
MMDVQQIIETYSGAPTDWVLLEQDVEDLYRYDKLNVMSVTVDDLMILLECRRELMRRDAKQV